MRVTVFIMTFLICASCLFQGCKETPPEPPKPATIALKAEDASCTEAWLRVTAIETPATVRLLRDGLPSSVLRLLSSDSLMIDENLLPKHTYTYQLQKLNTDSSIAETSASVQLTTMDTTSHNFTWSIDTLGVTSSVLYDVAIINDTLAYAVGEMYLRDSTGQVDPIFYNVAKWNGRQWTLQKILYNGGPFPGRWILVFSENDIWVNEHAHWDGTRWNFLFVGDPIFSGVRTNKAWGTSSRDFYVVGDGGFIAHYTGSTWQRVESGTSVNINDIWGVASAANQSLALAPASNRYSAGEKKLLRVSSDGYVDTLAWFPARRSLSVWFNSPRKIFAGGDGVFVGISERWGEVLTIPRNTTTRIRGTAYGNVWTVGAFGLCCHFNGITWRSYSEVALSFGSYEGLATSEQLMISVGQEGNRAVALVGRRP